MISISIAVSIDIYIAIIVTIGIVVPIDVVDDAGFHLCNLMEAAWIPRVTWYVAIDTQ